MPILLVVEGIEGSQNHHDHRNVVLEAGGAARQRGHRIDDFGIVEDKEAERLSVACTGRKSCYRERLVEQLALDRPLLEPTHGPPPDREIFQLLVCDGVFIEDAFVGYALLLIGTVTVRSRAILENRTRAIDHRIGCNNPEVFAQHVVPPAKRVQRTLFRTRGLGDDLAIDVDRLENVVLREHRAPGPHQQPFLKPVDIPAHQEDVRVVLLQLCMIFGDTQQHRPFFPLKFPGKQGVVCRGKRSDPRR